MRKCNIRINNCKLKRKKLKYFITEKEETKCKKKNEKHERERNN